MPHNFFGSGPVLSPRPRRTKPGGQERGAAKRNKWRGPRERSVDGGGGGLCRLRVTLERTARRGLFPRGERPALGTRRHPRQDRKALRKPGCPFRKVGSRRFGLEPRNPGPGFAGWGFLLVHRAMEWI